MSRKGGAQPVVMQLLVQTIMDLQVGSRALRELEFVHEKVGCHSHR